MIGQLLPIACAAYLIAAFPAYAQTQNPYDPASNDRCGGDSCASDAYDFGYRDGYDGHSYSSRLQFQNNPQYEAGFSEGEMDAMVEKETDAADEQARDERPRGQRGAHQANLLPDGRGLLSRALDGANALTAHDEVEEESAGRGSFH
jgi:hypothetical protein